MRRSSTIVLGEDPAIVNLLRSNLAPVESAGTSFAHAESLEEIAGVIQKEDNRVAVIDSNCGKFSATEVVSKVRATSEKLPVICLVEEDNPQAISNLLACGADAYLNKSNISPELLDHTISHALIIREAKTPEGKTKRLQDELEVQNQLLEECHRKVTSLYHATHEFVDNVSHELRTPLTVVKEYTSLIHDGLVGEINDDQKDLLNNALIRVDDLASMVEDMLDSSKLRTGLLNISRQETQASEVIERLKTSFQRKADAFGVCLEIDIPQDLPWIYCDPAQIARVLRNLAANAVKFAEEGGVVRIWVKHKPDKDCVVVGVTDNGPGIRPQALTQIFEAFQQIGDDTRRSTKGLGLGLSIVKDLVHLNFGDIEVHSVPGEGSEFSFSVPLAGSTGIIEHYLQRLGEFRGGSSFVSMVKVNAAEIGEPGSLDMLDTFLQNQIRRTDLVFRQDQRAWLIVAATNTRGLNTMIGRIIRSREETNRNTAGIPLPALEYQVQGNWRVKDQQSELVQMYSRLIRAREGVNV